MKGVNSMKKVCKPRGIKLNGERSEDMCEGCCSFGCDPMSMSVEYIKKMSKRQDAGVCPSCGANPCKCKSSLSAKPVVPICSVCNEPVLGRVYYVFSRKYSSSKPVHGQCLKK